MFQKLCFLQPPEGTQILILLITTLPVALRYTVQRHWKLVLRSFLGGKLPKRLQNGKIFNCIMRPNLFDTVKYALNTMVKYNMAYYTNTPYETSLQNSNNDLHDLQIPKDGS